MKIVIIGSGSFGTAMAQELSSNSQNHIQLLFRNKKDAEAFNQSHINEKYFPNRQLDKAIQGVSNLKVIRDVDIVFIAVPTQNIEALISDIQPHLSAKTLLVNLAKGINHSGQTIVNLLIEKLKHKNTVTLKGPSFSAEMINRQATLLTLGFSHKKQLMLMQKTVRDTNLFLDYTSDIQGVELLSTLKNIYAIFLGNIDAKYNAANTRFLILTKAFSEIKLILKYLGGREETLFLGCGLGDVNLTALNDLSRNRTLGLLIGKGFYNPSYEKDAVVLEGVKALRLVKRLIPEKLFDRLPLFQKLDAFFIDKNSQALQLDFEDLFKKNYKTVITYGTYDLLHFGHLEILRRAKELGDRLIVGLSTEEFNQVKGKNCRFSYEKRKEFLDSLSYVDLVIPENNWEQKEQDIQDHEVDIFVMGHDWKGKFDFLKQYCDVHYFERTKGISTTELKKLMKE